MPILNPAPRWQASRSDFIVLWHGCTAIDKANVEKNGISLAACAIDTDFGRGFYTTTVERQAKQWAWRRFLDWQKQNRRATGNEPVVMRFQMRRYSLTKKRLAIHERGIDDLLTLAFVHGDYGNDDYWSLVQHCRASTTAKINDHRRAPNRWYDVVIGPVAAFWTQRVAMPDADQVSFHTKSGIQILDGLIQHGLGSRPNGDPDFYTWSPVQ
jgi:Protein of unknown function (DUF3990)